MRSGQGPKENVPLANHSGNAPACTGATICRICLLTELTSVIRVTDAPAQSVNDVHNILAPPTQPTVGWRPINQLRIWSTLANTVARSRLHIQCIWADPTRDQCVVDLVCWKATLVPLRPHGRGSAPYCADNGESPDE